MPSPSVKNSGTDRSPEANASDVLQVIVASEDKAGDPTPDWRADAERFHDSGQAGGRKALAVFAVWGDCNSARLVREFSHSESFMEAAPHLSFAGGIYVDRIPE